MAAGEGVAGFESVDGDGARGDELGEVSRVEAAVDGGGIGGGGDGGYVA